MKNKCIYEWDTKKEATCNSDGSKDYECKWCHKVKDTQPIPKTNHEYVEFIKTKATCEHAGCKMKHCKWCGLLKDWEEPIIIPQLVHTEDFHERYRRMCHRHICRYYAENIG